MTEIEFFKGLYLEDLDRVVSYKDINNATITRKRASSRIIRMLDNIEITESRVNEFKNVWVWSDLHFGHTNIISYCERPFLNVQEMDEYLMANFNDYVEPDDCCIWVGDISFYGKTKSNEILDQLNGYNILVAGNHDMEKSGNLKDLTFDEVHSILHIDNEETPLVFTHYPMYNLMEPWYNVCGHLHNGKQANDSLTEQHINVSCELLNYRPINLKEILKMVQRRNK
jgi:calcineurin-like phosphoesterase family protein